jgi:hypothetical protein
MFFILHEMQCMCIEQCYVKNIKYQYFMPLHRRTKGWMHCTHFTAVVDNAVT